MTGAGVSKEDAQEDEGGRWGTPKGKGEVRINIGLVAKRSDPKMFSLQKEITIASCTDETAPCWLQGVSHQNWIFHWNMSQTAFYRTVLMD